MLLRCFFFLMPCYFISFFFFFFNDTATTEIYTLSLHDALPILICSGLTAYTHPTPNPSIAMATDGLDRKSTRLNSSHTVISYAVFCLKKKKKKQQYTQIKCFK